MSRRRRFLLYAQHLSGVGHFVRTFEIARGLSAKSRSRLPGGTAFAEALDPGCQVEPADVPAAGRHEVYLVDGGRPVPRPRRVG